MTRTDRIYLNQLTVRRRGRVDEATTSKKSSQVMSADSRFATNPSGALLDPGHVAATWRGRADEDGRHLQTEGGGYPPRGAFDIRLPLAG
jgi:hypothetical protein